MKTKQERIDHLANRVRNFRVAISGGGELSGGFGDLPDKDVTIEHLESAFNNFRLSGTQGISTAGDIESGYIIRGG